MRNEQGQLTLMNNLQYLFYSEQNLINNVRGIIYHKNFNCENLYLIASVFSKDSMKQSSLLYQIGESELNMHKIHYKAWNSQSCCELETEESAN